MTLYVYIKKNSSPKREAINYFSYFSLIIGFLLLFWSFYPILSFEIYAQLFLEEKILSPLPSASSVSGQAASVLGTTSLSSDLKDFTEVNRWFPKAPNISVKPSDNVNKAQEIKEYFLSIPRLNIKNAKVIVNGSDLTNNLIHYLPKSMPGEYGNVVIFGHSTLPQLYNIKDYKTIFTYLPSLESGDKVYIHVNDVDYEYEIYEMFVVEPDQISVLEQRTDAAYLTLITCVPPGTYWKRLVVKAKLTKLPLN